MEQITGSRSPNVVQYGPNTRHNGGGGRTKDQHEPTRCPTPLNLQNLHPRFKSGRRLHFSAGIFRAVMGMSPAEAYMPIARAWDFSTARVVADLGGGGGALIAAILEAFPNTKGMLVDRPESIEAARPRFSTGPLAQRTQLVTADLTQEVPNGADVYILKHVLHGCTDEAATDILRRCRAVTPPDGRVLIVEFVLPDVIDRVDRDLESRLMSDLNMLAVTAGKERSALEWKSLIDKAGLRYERIIPVAEDLVSIIEARV
jgi:ubiquinone/menaquinone biosynthesis C-methylase UbiE